MLTEEMHRQTSRGCAPRGVRVVDLWCAAETVYGHEIAAESVVLALNRGSTAREKWKYL